MEEKINIKTYIKNCLSYYTTNNNKLNSLEFFITNKCNYKCEYCYSGFSPDSKNADNKTIDSFINLVQSLKPNARIKLIGGEPVIHPRFVEIACLIMKNNHDLKIGTNFSLPNKHFEKIIDAAGSDSKMHLTISLHLSQIENYSDFIQKIIDLKKYAGRVWVTFNVVSVLLEDKFDLLVNIRNELITNNINMTFQRLKTEDGGFYKYSEKIENYLSEQFSERKATKIESLNPYGILCKTGCKFVRIDVDGNVYRCYNYQEKLFSLGNINDEFRVFKRSMPCLSNKCTCLLPVSWDLIEFNKNNKKLAEKIQQEKTFYDIAKKIYKKKINK